MESKNGLWSNLDHFRALFAPQASVMLLTTDRDLQRPAAHHGRFSSG
jgi:hypothetical protein